MAGNGDYNEQIIAVFPKNDTTEIRMAIKRVKTRATGRVQEFIDVREYWFKDGPMAEPLATRKGAMVNRTNIGNLLRALILSLKDGELTEEEIAVILSKMETLGSKETGDDEEAPPSDTVPPDYDDDDSV
jgi:hypothetical protein